MNKEQLKDVLAKENISADTLLLKLINATGLTQESIQKLVKMQTPKLINSQSEVRPGMFLTSEGYVSQNYVADEVIALVLGCEKGKVKALCLEGKEMPFSTSHLFVDTSGHDGLSATRLIVKTAHEKHLSAEAAEYCQQFTINGLVKKGDAYLLSAEEVRDVQSYFFNIQEALRSVNMTIGCLWSSTMSVNGKEISAGAYDLHSTTMYQETVIFAQFVHPAFLVPFRKK